MAKIVATAVSGRPITLASGVNHVRFLGLKSPDPLLEV